MVLSGPFTYQDQNYVLELIKDVSNSDILPELPEKSPEAIAQMIRDMHNAIIRDNFTDLFNRGASAKGFRWISIVRITAVRPSPPSWRISTVSSKSTIPMVIFRGTKF